MFLNFGNLKNESTGDRYWGKTIEKTMLRVLRSRTFSHSLGRHRTPRHCSRMRVDLRALLVCSKCCGWQLDMVDRDQAVNGTAVRDRAQATGREGCAALRKTFQE